MAFLFPGREKANGSCDNFDAFPAMHKKLAYRFVGQPLCSEACRVRVVGVAFLFPRREPQCNW